MPCLTDWVLWTRHPLTKGDQRWFFALTTRMRLHNWTSAHVEDHLSGPAEILRGTYFGELILTHDSIAQLRDQAIERIKTRWHPDVHQTVDAERTVRRMLADSGAWAGCNDIAERLRSSVDIIESNKSTLPPLQLDEVEKLIKIARTNADSLTAAVLSVNAGDYEVLNQILVTVGAPQQESRDIVRRLRSTRHPLALIATNVFADVHGAHDALNSMLQLLSTPLVAIVADAGCGKTHVAAKLTEPTASIPPGVLLFGADLHAGHSLNDLAQRIVIQGKPVASFEALLAALDAAGQRTGRRLPLVIDGLNEAEDPRKWKSLLASLQVVLPQYPYVCVICTLRSAFVAEALPDEVRQLEIANFEHDTDDAIRRYFDYYKIDRADADLPWEMLQHPLTLRMFCEVTNPDRVRTVGVERMPTSLTALFEEYLAQAAQRISELSSRTHRYYAPNVRSAINSIGLALWEEKTRSVRQADLRRRLSDESLPWSDSIVRLLEDEGILIRDADRSFSSGREAVVFDLLAGHIVADALFDKFGGTEFQNWLNESATIARLRGPYDERHPLAEDIFRAFVGLTPHRMARRQLWQLTTGDTRFDALRRAAWLEARYLDANTVTELASIAVSSNDKMQLLDRLWSTRSALRHPLNSDFLDRVLRPLPIPDRDLRWSEWIRANQKEIIADLVRLKDRWNAHEQVNDRDRLRARWIMWLLTSTVRVLRDHATHALYSFGSFDPNKLFMLTIESLEINDPYVPERMVAAAYGVSMSLWADPKGDKLRELLPAFARDLVKAMWAPGAPHATWHTLTQDYSLGVIKLAQRVRADCLSDEDARHLHRPFRQIPSPFRPTEEIDDSVAKEADSAIHMDFGNYTIGGLIPHRDNYNFKNKEYRDVRRKIESRILELGYSGKRFGQIDRQIADEMWHVHHRGIARTDRYGKKYSWIAYFEMYGLRHDQHQLPDRREGERTPDVDIDPSFPRAVVVWKPQLPNVFAATATDIPGWLAHGPTPEYGHLLRLDDLAGEVGPWLLANGFVEQSSVADGRRVFTFLRGILVSKSNLPRLISAFQKIDYPGNVAIPDPGSDHYTFAGEIPWSNRFGNYFREQDGGAKRHLDVAFRRYGSKPRDGIRVELAVHEFAWESYHSELNQETGVMFLAPALCDRLKLVNRCGEWDLYDQAGGRATIARNWKEKEDQYDSSVLYVRRDLLELYLKSTRQVLVWLMWGERGFDHATMQEHQSEIQAARIGYRYIHRTSETWKP